MGRIVMRHGSRPDGAEHGDPPPAWRPPCGGLQSVSRRLTEVERHGVVGVKSLEDTRA